MLSWFGLVARLVVGGVWIVAGALKIGDPIASVASVRAYEIGFLNGQATEIIGYLLPALELVVGLALVLGVLVRGAAAVSALLFVVFIVGIASAWARGLEIDCGCFGNGGAAPGAASDYPWEIARDVALLAASIFLVWLDRSRLALDNLLFRRAATGPDPDTENETMERV